MDLPGDVGLNGHACWAYQDVSGDLRNAVAAFLAEGIELGQRLMFVGGPETERAVCKLEPMASWVADGSLVIAPFEQVYPGGHRLPNDEQWAMYCAVIDQALADGFTGLRVVAEVTSLAASDPAGHEHAHWETYADRQMPHRPFAALCCFDRTVLSSQALATIASAHPIADRRLEELAPFRLFGRGDMIALAGEVDAFSSATLGRLLDAEDGAHGTVVLDLSGLDFIDHTGFRVIEEHSRNLLSAGRSLLVQGEPAAFRRIESIRDHAR